MADLTAYELEPGVDSRAKRRGYIIRQSGFRCLCQGL